jgi:hypothetical protein
MLFAAFRPVVVNERKANILLLRPLKTPLFTFFSASEAIRHFRRSSISVYLFRNLLPNPGPPIDRKGLLIAKGNPFSATEPLVG